MITCYTVPEIWRMTNAILIFHFEIFFALLPPNSPKNDNFKTMKKKTLGYIIILHNCAKNHNHILHCSWDMACDNYNSHFLFWAIFCLPLPLTAPKITISKHMKKAPGDIIILHKCTKNHDHDHDHMLSCSWDMACDKCNYFSFWAIFCPFTTFNSPKNRNFRKMKKMPGYHHFTHVYQKLCLLRYGTW